MPLKEELEHLQGMESGNCGSSTRNIQNGANNGEIICNGTDTGNDEKASPDKNTALYSNKVSDSNDESSSLKLGSGATNNSDNLTKKKDSEAGQIEVENLSAVVPKVNENSTDQVDNNQEVKLATDMKVTDHNTSQQDTLAMEGKSDVIDGNVDDEKMESLTKSVPPLSESALNLPALPPAYIKMSFHPEQSVVSTNLSA